MGESQRKEPERKPTGLADRTSQEGPEQAHDKDKHRFRSLCWRERCIRGSRPLTSLLRCSSGPLDNHPRGHFRSRSYLRPRYRDSPLYPGSPIRLSFNPPVICPRFRFAVLTSAFSSVYTLSPSLPYQQRLPSSTALDQYPLLLPRYARQAHCVRLRRRDP